MSDDRTTLSDLRAVWEQVDPPPVDLAERMIAMVSSFDLDLELLTLISASEVAAGARTATAEGVTSRLEFSNGEVTVLLQVGPLVDGVRRLDGWATHTGTLDVRLSVQGVTDDLVAEAVSGRFSFEQVPPGLARLILTPAGAAARPFATPTFEI